MSNTDRTSTVGQIYGSRPVLIQRCDLEGGSTTRRDNQFQILGIPRFGPIRRHLTVIWRCGSWGKLKLDSWTLQRVLQAPATSICWIFVSNEGLKELLDHIATGQPYLYMPLAERS